MWAILWPLWGYKVMASLNILPFFPLQKNKGWLYHLLIYSITAITEIESCQVAFPLSFMQTHTHLSYSFLFLLFSTASLPSQPCVYSCCFIMYLFQLSCVSLGMGKNKNLLAHYARDSTNIIQWHEDFFLLYIFGPPKAKLDLQEQISSGLGMGKKKQARMKCLIKDIN